MLYYYLLHCHLNGREPANYRKLAADFGFGSHEVVTRGIAELKQLGLAEIVTTRRARCAALREVKAS